MDLTLGELRRYTARTQVEAARAAEVTQSELSRLERRGDLRLSTLRRYLAALGGTLELTVQLGSSTFRLVPEGRTALPEGTDADAVPAAIDGLASLPSWLPALLAGRSRAQLTRRLDGCGPFSLTEHVWHLRDLELEGYGERLGRILAEGRPALPDFDGDRAAVERGYNGRGVALALRALTAARRRHLARLRRLGAPALARTGALAGVGELTLAALVLRWRCHDLGHRLEMERLAERLGKADLR